MPLQTECAEEKTRGAGQERGGGKKGLRSARSRDSFVIVGYFIVLLPKNFLAIVAFPMTQKFAKTIMAMKNLEKPFKYCVMMSFFEYIHEKVCGYSVMETVFLKFHVGNVQPLPLLIIGRTVIEWSIFKLFPHKHCTSL